MTFWWLRISFGDADYKHWGRLEAYARFNDATIAVLVAEGFEDLMVQDVHTA